MGNPVVHFELPADDVERATEFYREAFGWQIRTASGMGYALIATTPASETGEPLAAGAINGGLLARQAPITSVVITIEVEDIDVALEAVTRRGGTVVRGREAVGPIGFAAYFRDPEGNVLGLWQAIQQAR